MYSLITIIMTTYNRADFIKESVASVQAQDYTNWELLIEDDGSTDNTEEIVAQIKDDRIHYTLHEHTGITGTLKNRALKKARGEFIAFIDSDDLWVNDKLSLQSALLKDCPAAKFSISNWQDFYDVNHLHKPYYPETGGIYTGNIFKEYSRAERLAHIQTLLFKKECLEKTGLFNENRRFTDYSFIGKLTCHYHAVVVNKPLLLRRLHNNNNSSVNWADDYIEYHETVLQYIKDGKLSFKEIRDTLFMSYINLGERYIQVGEKRKAIHYYLLALRCNPLNIIPIKKLIKTVFL